MFSNIYL